MARSQRLFYTTTYHCWGRRKKGFSEEKGFLSSWVNVKVVCIILAFPCEPLLSCSLCYYYCCCYYVFSCFTAVPKTLSLSQSMIFMDLQDSLQLATGGGGKGKQGATEQHMESLSGGTGLENIIPKPQQRSLFAGKRKTPTPVIKGKCPVLPLSLYTSKIEIGQTRGEQAVVRSCLLCIG